jgi:hypothetical protein
MQQHGFSDLTTVECLARPHNVRDITLDVVDLGDSAQPESRANDEISAQENVGSASVSDQSGEDVAKRARTGESKISAENEGSAMDAEESQNGSGNSRGGSCRDKGSEKVKKKTIEMKATMSPKDLQGHTGFLTFASLH